MENGNAKERRIAQELELLKQYQRVSVKDLAATLEVSEMTIRRDLDLLRKNHVLERSYGYATLAKGGDGYAYDGEVYDARKEIPGWAEPGSNGGNWRAVSAVDYDMNVLTAQGSGKVREMDEVPAKRIFTTPEGDTVIDFGQNMTGHIRVHARGKSRRCDLKLHCF